MNLTLIIRNGRVVDGTGNAWYRADVGIAGSVISAVGSLESESAPMELDTTNKIVAPGFIDIHTHSDVSSLINPRVDSKLQQGITTDVIGQCGWSVAPLPQTLEGQSIVKGIFQASHPVIPENWNWNTFAEYGRRIEDDGTSMNLAGFVGHSTVRSCVMGGSANKATAAELEAMKELVADAMDDGAFGLSTGLAYMPGCYADIDEVAELAKVVAAKGGIYASHIRALHDKVKMPEATAEALEIGRRAGIPVQLSHFTPRTSMQGNAGLLMGMLERARDEGIEVTCDLFVYDHGQAMLRAFLPPWAREGGDVRIVERCQDPKLREQIKQAWREGISGTVSPKTVLATNGEWEKLWIEKAILNPDLDGMTIKDIAEERGVDPFDLLLDLLVEEEGKLMLGGQDAIEEDIETVLRHPLSMPASDGYALAPYGELGKGKVHGRSYGNHAKVLGHYVRERGVLSLEEAVRKMTSFPAQKLGIQDRGLLRVGMKADVTVFDPKKIADMTTRAKPYSYPIGVTAVIVNGAVALQNGIHMGYTAGKFLRHGIS